MYKLYRIKARPFWDHWQTATSFYGSMLSLGGLLMTPFAYILMSENTEFLQTMSLIIALGLGIESIGLLAHSSYLKSGLGEAQATHYEQITTFGKTYRLRNNLLVFSIGIALAIGILDLSQIFQTTIIIALTLSVLTSAYMDRILFYALVIPTTIPGAYFWKNKGFVDHARQTGLADMQQLGVAYERHHPFNIRELMKTLKEHRLVNILTEAKAILRRTYT
jgi:DMSO reductase anchor subunit